MGSGRSAEVASKRLRPSGCQSGSGDVGAMPNFQRQAVKNASPPAHDTRTPGLREEEQRAVLEGLLQLCLLCASLVKMTAVFQMREMTVLRGSPVDHCLAMHSSMSTNEMFCSRPMLSRAPPSPKNEYGLVGALQ